MPDLLKTHYAFCENLVREQDKDRWLASLFANPAKRHHLFALYAFSLEVARIRDIVSEPMPGEIRLQWWQDAIEGEARGDVSSHPVAAALIDTIRTFKLPRVAFVALIEARRFDLYDDPMPDMTTLEGYCGETSSILIRLASLILQGDGEPGGAEAAGHAGVAYAITGLLRAYPWTSVRGQLFVPKAIFEKHGLSREAMIAGKNSPELKAALAELRGKAWSHYRSAKAGLSEVSASGFPAFLPLFLVPLYLKRMEKGSYEPFGTIIEVPQWRRQWALWRASKTI